MYIVQPPKVLFCIKVLNNQLPGLAHYLQAVFIVSNFLEDLINLKLGALLTFLPTYSLHNHLLESP